MSGFLFSRPSGVPPTPSPADDRVSPLDPVGGGHTRLAREGVGGPISDEGTDTVLL